MARHASTYRQARRAAYWANPQLYKVVSWAEFNEAYGDFANQVGTLPAKRAPFAPKPSEDYRGKMGAKDKARMDRSK